MTTNKTQPTPQSVDKYLLGIDNPTRRKDAKALTNLIKSATKAEPVMWGTGIVGFGNYHYKYESGREGDTMAVGFAARKQALVIYGLFHFKDNQQNIELAKRLGTHTHGKGCLYISNLADINLEVLGQIIANAFLNRASQ